ncbi:MAG: protein kinase [Candidatus Obscuribacterales bacterium]|nr:protein kinase [Candidatus Obscuribacterales bacterium]
MSGSHSQANSHSSADVSSQIILRPGDIVGDRYLIRSMIGQGGMGMVFQIEQVFLGKVLALKTLSNSRLSDSTVRRFQHEARAAFAIDHPNLITVHDFGLLDGKIPYLIMDYINGKSLAQRIAEKGMLDAGEAIPIFLHACFGLGYAHQKGVVHRDVKPSNIMLVENNGEKTEGLVKIVDFGLAKFTQKEGDSIQSLTRTGEIFGSPLYMSPEQCASQPVDERSDIYSLGCVFFETLTGTPPFIGQTALATMMLHMGQQAPTLKEASMGKDFPALLEHIVAKMLEKQPADRYQSLAQVTGELAALERQLKDPRAQANTVVLQKKSAAAGKPSNCFQLSKNIFALIMTATILLSSAISSFVTHKLVTESEIAERKKTPPAAYVAPHNYVNRETIRPEISNESLTANLNRYRKDGICRLKLIDINDFGFDKILQSPWIVDLDLLGSGINNKRLAELSSLPNLKSVTLSHTNLDDTGAAGLSKCQKLISVSAGWSSISAKAIPYFLSMPQLRSLDLSGIRLDRESIKFLAGKSTLEYLRIPSTSGISDENLAPLANSNIKHLDIENLPLGDTAAFHISKMRKLEYLSIRGTNIGLSGLKQLLTNRNLRTVVFCPTQQLKTAAVRKLAKGKKLCRFVQCSR